MKVDPQLRQCLAILSRIGLLSTNLRLPKKVPKCLPIQDFIACARLEPRIMEVLPAAIKFHPQYFSGIIPPEINNIIAQRSRKKTIYGVEVKKCQFWLRYPTPESYYRDW